jgi:hypothetical protein
MTKILDTVLLLALPASGKSEVRKYLAGLEPDVCRNELHLGPTVQLDDYPYVHLMHRIDDELLAAGAEYVYYNGPDKPFQESLSWGLLTGLLNEDYDDLVNKRVVNPASAAEHLFERLDRARVAAGGHPIMAKVPAAARATAAAALEAECRAQLDEKQAVYTDLAGRTVIIEAARGGADGSSFPLQGYQGYQYMLSALSDAILDTASILYIWVTPEESRRKNTERTDPNDPGSILHHGVPMSVMLGEYGCDDIEYLMAQSDVPDTIRVEKNGKVWNVPIGRFDNRVDKTSFLRGEKADWAPEQVAAIHDGLAGALAAIARNV